MPSDGLLTASAAVIVLVLAAVGGLYVARRALRGGSGAGQSAAFSLADLRSLRSRGQITEAEFQVLRRSAIDGVAGAADRAASGASPQAGAGPASGHDVDDGGWTADDDRRD